MNRTNLHALFLRIANEEAGGVRPVGPDGEYKEDTTGFGLEVFPEAKSYFNSPPTEEEIEKFYKRWHHLFMYYSHLRLGWYYDNETAQYELNIGAMTPYKQKAIDTAKKLDQKAIFDIAHGTEIQAGGTNRKLSFPNYGLAQRMHDLGVQ